MNIQAMMKQAQEMQERLKKQMSELRVEATAGGGMVTVMVSGDKQLQSIKIDPEVVSKDDVEMLQDLILAAINDAHRKALPYHLFHISTRLLRLHKFVQHDGPISIARSFHAADWQRLLAAGGVSVPPARIERVFPYRLCVSRFHG